ncbi:glutamate racemase [Ekhidna lutea]|uniref:Glutamate racemase n=1 Tax=Ekhidna lutea TaxID=447679 RepID=A0A239HLZ8_EKHLU|nr:glutamate racemase [Ekhidna lutea]SNS82367.1 glutamate racemase [Ekhidna lutea]
MKSNQPIGIFDSGIGGLTVARAVKKVLPNESIIYFGDTAHLPYGDKSTAAIQAYSVRIAEMLLKEKCKVILIACNSASSAAYELVTEYVGKKARVFDVINPTVDFIRENHRDDKIGLIGTKQTISAGVYARKIEQLKQNIDFASLATPLLVPMIEEGIHDDIISTNVISKYLNDPLLNGIKSLILGCTHYPIIKNEIGQHYADLNEEVEIIDSAETVANALKSFLEYNQLINKGSLESDRFMVSDFTPSFEHTTKTFFGKEVHLERVPIWDELH